MTARPGRPPRAGRTATERIQLRVTKLELRTWQAAAEAAGVTLSEWVRRALAERKEGET